MTTDPILFINYLFLITIMCLGAFIVVKDVRIGKIKNHLIIIGFISGLALCAFQLFFAVFYLKNYNSNYFLDVILNTSVSAIVGYLFWRYQFWAAGDAKLFILFSFLIPLDYYSKDYLKIFPSFALLANIFIPIFFLLLSAAVLNFFKNILLLFNGRNNSVRVFLLEEKNKFAKQFVDKKEFFIFLNSLALTIMILPILRTGLYEIIERFAYHISIVVFLIIYFSQIVFNDIFSNFFRKKNYSLILLVASFIYIAIVLFLRPSDIRYSLETTLIIGVVFRVIQWLINKISNLHLAQEVKNIPIADVKPGMIISDELIGKLEEKMKQRDISMENISGDGLTPDQVRFLKSWYGQERKMKTVQIFNTISFAPWIFAGVIITLILKQSVVHYFLSILKDGF